MIPNLQWTFPDCKMVSGRGQRERRQRGCRQREMLIHRINRLYDNAVEEFMVTRTNW